VVAKGLKRLSRFDGDHDVFSKVYGVIPQIVPNFYATQRGMKSR
jgi:hypothetical protein